MEQLGGKTEAGAARGRTGIGPAQGWAQMESSPPHPCRGWVIGAHSLSCVFGSSLIAPLFGGNGVVVGGREPGEPIKILSQ